MGGIGAAPAVILAVIVVSMVAGVEAQKYTCWGGCYNVCILKSRADNPQGLPCYFECLNSECVPHSLQDFQYYCQIGCSLQNCGVFTSDGVRLEECLDGCDNQCRV